MTNKQIKEYNYHQVWSEILKQDIEKWKKLKQMKMDSYKMIAYIFGCGVCIGVCIGVFLTAIK